MNKFALTMGKNAFSQKRYYENLIDLLRDWSERYCAGADYGYITQYDSNGFIDFGLNPNAEKEYNRAFLTLK